VTEDAPGFDPVALLAVLERHGVRYLVIGGVAAGIHGGTRTTQDLDIVPAPGRPNAERLAVALRELDARLKGVDADLLPVDPTDPSDLEAGANFTLTTRLGDLDVLPEPEGFGDWDQIAGRAERLDVGAGAPVAVIGLDDLIALKRAAGRRQDIEDIVQLTAGALVAERSTDARVRLDVPLADTVTDADALEAADIATASYEGTVEFAVSRTPDSRSLRIDARLSGFTPAHADTWASITVQKLAGMGVGDGFASRRVESLA
jgi:hypothetical protein